MVITALTPMKEICMKTTVYLNKDTEELYRRAKEIEPNYSISDAVKEGIKLFVNSMEAKYSGMQEIILFEGTEYRAEGEEVGKRVKFVGKVLGSIETRRVGEFEAEFQKLFLTRKGKYILETFYEDTDGTRTSSFEICHTLEELREKADPYLLMNAGETKGELLEELDV
jgi:hypothetical protein